jgi:hypothetical protein
MDERVIEKKCRFDAIGGSPVWFNENQAKCPAAAG